MGKTVRKSIDNICVSTLNNNLPFSKIEKITFDEFKVLYEKLMNVDWVYNGEVINLIERGWTFKFDNRKRALGCCMGKAKIIRISKFLLKKNLHLPSVWEDTIRHEIAHALDFEVRGTSDHSYRWKLMCAVTGADPSRVEDTPLNYDNAYKYYLECPNCDYKFGMFRKPRVKRACGNCCNKFNNGFYSEKYIFKIVENNVA